MQKLLINPPQGGNEDIQSLPLGYLSAKWRAPVVDLNTCPSQVWDTSHDENLISVQSRSVGAARRIIEEHPQSTFRSVTTPIDVQCCYRFVPLQKNLHVLDLPGVPRYDLFSSYPTFKANWQSGMWPYALLTSLGCPYSCTYCDARNRQWSGWDGQRLREELTQAVDSYGVRVVTTLDDCINLHEDHVVRVSSLFSDFGIEWMCTNGLRADRLTEKSAKAMSWSGCKTVGFGIESSDQGVLDAIKKGEKVEDLERGIRIARDYFDSVSGFVILGLPGSSYDSDAQTLEWAIDQGIYIHVSYYVPDNGGGVIEDAVFYGEGSRASTLAAYSVVDQQRLMRQGRGLSWGSRRDVWANVAARARLAVRKPAAAWRYLKMDWLKLKARVGR